MMQSAAVIHGTMRLPYARMDGILSRLEPERDRYQIVAVVDETVVGFAELLTTPDHPRHSHVGEVNLVFVHPDWQGRGVGRRLMNAMVDLGDNWLRIRRLELTVWDANDTARSLYESCGFSIEGRFKDYVFTNGRYHDALKMARVVDTE